MSNEEWEKGYQQFIEFIEKEGHSNVTLYRSGELSLWVRNQRRHYKEYLAGDVAQLPPDRLALLRQAHFPFDVGEERWMTHYRELCQYIKDNGHCRVPLTYTSLGLWVSNQRMKYKKQKQNNTIIPTLTEKRIEMLQEQGFIWDVSEWVFDQKIRELHEFTRGGGRLEILKSHDGQLGRWLAVQKRQYRKYIMNETHTLTEYRVNALEGAGISTNLINNDIVWGPSDVEWKDRIKQLTAFYKKHGHTNVPRDGALGNWVKKVRERMFSDKERGTVCEIKKARLQDLERLNFIWNANTYKWNKKYEALLEFRREHGHCNVPSSHSALGLWVGTQRREYAKLMNERPSQITLDRIEQLENAGFEWTRVPAVQAQNDQSFHDRVQEYLQWNRTDNAEQSQPLIWWMERIRTLYRKWLRGKKTPLTQERIKILEEIGIVDDIRQVSRQEQEQEQENFQLN